MDSMSVDVQTCNFLNRGLMGIFAHSPGLDINVLQKIDWHWLETRCSPTELSSGSMMAWTQTLSDGSHLIARVVRTPLAGEHASWSVRAIVVETNTYSELIDRMAHCLSDDNFWNRQCFVDGTATQVPKWDRDDAIQANDVALVKAAIAQVKSEGIARIDRTTSCDPWELTVRSPAALQGANRTRLRWIVGFDSFPRGTHLVAGRYASHVGRNKTKVRSAPSKKLQTISPTHLQTNPKLIGLKSEDPEVEGEWEVSRIRSTRYHVIVPATCILVILGSILFAVFRVRFI